MKLKDVPDKLYTLFRRKTASTHFIPAIDGLRFLAIWVVVMDHIHGFIRTKIPFAYTKPATDYPLVYHFFDAQGLKGVLLFFMISGFILGLPFAKHYWQDAKDVKLKSYFLRRLTRLEPPYMLNMLVCYFLIILLPGHGFSAEFPRTFKGLWPSLASSLVYLHYVLMPQNSSINPVSWSLEIEIQFYLLVPLLVLMFKLPKLYRRGALIFLILLLPFLQRHFSLPVNAMVRPANFIYNYLQYFLLGFLLVDVYLSGFKLKLNRWVGLILTLLALTAFFYPQTYTTPNFDYISLFTTFALGVLVLCNQTAGQIFSWRLFTSIGGMCYSIYLWHDLIVSAVGNFTINHNISHAYIPTILWQFCLIVPCVLLFSSAFYLLIEKPCMDREWPFKLWRFVKSFFIKSKPDAVPAES